MPFLVRWPGHIRAGRTEDAPIVHTDLYRTLANLVGCALPEDAGEDSFDLGPLWFDDATGAFQRDHLVHHSGQGVFGLRVGPWKLILGQSSGGFSRWQPPAEAPAGQLYDLSKSPGELRNVYAEHPEVVERLTARLEALRAAGRSAPGP